MNKYSLIAILVAIIIGAVFGAWFTNNLYRKDLIELNEGNKELQRERQVHLDSIGMLYKTIVTMDRVIQIDDSIISILKTVIHHQDSITQIKRDENANATPDQRKSWLLDRYNTKPK